MKNRLLLLLIPIMLLGACGNNNDQDISSVDDSSYVLDENEIFVYLYTSGVYSSKTDRIGVFTATKGELIQKPQDPVSKDEAFNTFMGWSTKLFIGDLSDLFDFNKPLDINYPTKSLTLYGQWDYK